jgi:hypothetical protein
MWKVLFFLFWLNIVSYATWYKIENKDDFGDVIGYTAVGKSDTNDVAVMVMKEGEVGISINPLFKLDTDVSFKFDDGTKYYLKFKRQSNDIIYIFNWELYHKIRSSKYMDMAISDTTGKKIIRIDNTGSNKIIGEVINFN